jgi:heme exporter protein C
MAQMTVSDLSEKPNDGRQGLVRDAVFAVSVGLMGVTLYLIFFWVPTELNLGVSQRIFYFHVPLGWLGMLSIVLVAIASLMYLLTGKEKWDNLAYSTAELGVVFASLILVTGVIWGKGDLGWWWTWDAKLTTTLILWFIYVAYLMVRAYAPRGSQGARYGAVVALIGAVDAPIIYMATVWWRTAHPELNTGPLAEEIDALGSSKIYATLLVSLVAFTALYISMLMERYSLRRSETALDEVHRIVS